MITSGNCLSSTNRSAFWIKASGDSNKTTPRSGPKSVREMPKQSCSPLRHSPNLSGVFAKINARLRSP